MIFLNCMKQVYFIKKDEDNKNVSLNFDKPKDKIRVYDKQSFSDDSEYYRIENLFSL